MKLAIVLLMSVVGFGQNNKLPALAFSGIASPNSPITVHECNDRHMLISIYADADALLPLPNPFLTNHRGIYTLFFTDKAIEISGQMPVPFCVHRPIEPKPHKPKPSVKPADDLYTLCRKNAGTVSQCKAEAAFVPDPCDGLACTGPVEMLPQKDGPPTFGVPQGETQNYEFTTISNIALVNSSNKCGWSSFTYDEKTKTCSIQITFSVEGQLVCTPLALDEGGLPVITCSYKPHDVQPEGKTK